MPNLTISDIAKKAGVSKTTVSRVLNHSASVKQETRKKVLSVIKEQNYSPSAAARSLSKNLSDTVGVIVPQLDNPFFGEIMAGITKMLDANNLTMICCNTNDDVQKDFAALETVKHHRVRGLLYTPASDYSNAKDARHMVRLLREIDTAVILMDRDIHGIEFDGVFFDDRLAVYQATKVLIEAGHRKIGIINAPLDKWSLASIRQSGFEWAHAEAGIPVESRYIFIGKYSIEAAYKAAKKLLAMPERPSAVVTCNNWISIGFLKALYERGEKLGEDIICFGLDRIEVLDIVGMDLNYIERDAFAMGKTAMELLIKRLAFSNGPKEKRILKSPIVLRKV